MATFLNAGALQKKWGDELWFAVVRTHRGARRIVRQNTVRRMMPTMRRNKILGRKLSPTFYFLVFALETCTMALKIETVPERLPTVERISIPVLYGPLNAPTATNITPAPKLVVNFSTTTGYALPYRANGAQSTQTNYWRRG